MPLFSLPAYPNATGYTLQYSDPTSSDPNAPNPLGPWNAVSGSPITVPSNIIDATGDQNLRLYRAAPIVTVNGTSYTYPFYQPFSVAMNEPGSYKRNLFDPGITALLPMFRSFIGDNGVPQVSSTELNLDSGAGIGLLQPDGVQTVFNLADVPDAIPAIVLEGSVSVKKNGVTLALGTDYYVNYDAGQVVFATAPSPNDSINIVFTEVQYTNYILNTALANAIERLSTVGVSGFSLHYDNNVCLLSTALSDNGIRYIIFFIAQKVLNHALIWAKAAAARSYKSGDFSMDTAPQRVLDGMSQQTQVEFGEIQSAVYRYTVTNTTPIKWGDYDSFLNLNGLLPTWSALYLLSPYAYWI